ncbi:hypothetical protein LSH36_1646g00003 [Paralvinella palmiformis]|uniref:G-protein coupled receptors family 1 profile domain-containing protein n=1 Tax=Paralvinella palmiformis TaxID=53620 RepID=A0AAD9MQX8_9ANNE|nr:hypothetical protein LSH36_1646g00003 [Paralvinella palmiformis]
MVVWKDRKTSSMSILMINLAIVDTLVLWIWANQVAVQALCAVTGSCSHYELIKPFLWAYLWPVGATVQLMATWSIVSITFTRFVSVCWSARATHLNSRRKVIIRLCIMYMFCLIFNLPNFFRLHVITDDDGRPRLAKSRITSSLLFIYGYQVFLYYLVIYIVPLTLVIYFTVRLYSSLRQWNKKREDMTAKARDNHDLTFSLVIVVLVFVICQLVNPIHRLLAAIYPKTENVCGSVRFYYKSWASILVNFNSASNFFIFCLCGIGFRRRLVQMCCRRGSVEPSHFMSNDTTRRGNMGRTIESRE